MIASIPAFFPNRFLPKNEIILSYSEDNTSFWERNRDNIIMVIITSIISGIIGYILGKVTKVIP